MGKLPQGAVKNLGLQGETWKYDEIWNINKKHVDLKARNKEV